MAKLPGRESFEGPPVDLLKDLRAMASLAKRMAKSLFDEDLLLFSKLSEREPSALFYISKPYGSDVDGRGAIAALDGKDPSFCFDAGLAWASVAGKRWLVEDAQTQLRGYAGPRIESGLIVRRPALAFVCGAAQSAFATDEFSEWLWSAGAEGAWTKKEFGAPELEIWGAEWAKQAKQQKNLGGWCSAVLGQALMRMWEGEQKQSKALLLAAESLGPPSKGWLVEALRLGAEKLEGEARSYKSRIINTTTILRADEKSDAMVKQWTEKMQAMAIGFCSRGPASWSANAVENGSHEHLQAKVELACLELATPSADKKRAPKRV